MRKYFLFLQKHPILMLSVFILCGLLARTVYLSSLPSELHRDEADIAYNAYSLLKTGKDEHGVTSPLIFESFGDYKLPVMVYLTKVSITLHGLNVGAIRLPNALIATLLIPVVYGLCYELFKRKQIALSAATVLTFSVWHVFLARTIYEPIAGLTFSSIGMYFLLKARKSSFWFIPSAVFFLISCFTYNLPMLFIPVIVVLTAVIYRKEYFSNNKSSKTASVSLMKVLGFLVVGVAFLIPFLVTLPLAQQKSGATLFSNQQLLEESNSNFATLIRHRLPYKVSVLMSNSYNTGFTQLVANYTAVWNPTYLFMKGNDNPWHSLQLIGVGEFHWGTIPFLLIGLAILIRKAPRWNKAELFLIFYILLSPIINSLTLDSPNTNRLMDFHLALTFVIALGLNWSFDQLRFSKNKIRKIFVIIFIAYYAVSWSNAMMKYFFFHSAHMDIKWHEGIGQTARSLEPLISDTDVVYLDVMNLPDYFLLFPQFAFYTKLDPQVFQTTAKWDKQNSFLAPNTFANYQTILPFRIDDLSIHNIARYFPGDVDTIVFVKRLSPSDKASSYQTTVINDYKGEPLWEIAKITRQQVEENTKTN